MTFNQTEFNRLLEEYNQYLGSILSPTKDIQIEEKVAEKTVSLGAEKREMKVACKPLIQSVKNKRLDRSKAMEKMLDLIKETQETEEIDEINYEEIDELQLYTKGRRVHPIMYVEDCETFKWS